MINNKVSKKILRAAFTKKIATLVRFRLSVQTFPNLTASEAVFCGVSF